jgi:hypothetical protein
MFLTTILQNYIIVENLAFANSYRYMGVNQLKQQYLKQQEDQNCVVNPYF